MVDVKVASANEVWADVNCDWAEVTDASSESIWPPMRLRFVGRQLRLGAGERGLCGIESACRAVVDTVASAWPAVTTSPTFTFTAVT